MSSYPVHPAVVHFPVVLWPLSALMRFAGTQPKLRANVPGLGSDASIFALAHHLNTAALLFSIPAVITGVRAYQTINPNDEAAHCTVRRHMILNSIVLLIGLYNFWSVRNAPGYRPSTKNVLLGLVAIALLFVSGHYGSKLAYTHGVGQKKEQSAPWSI